MRTDSTDLAHVLEAQRAIVDQATGLAVFLAGCLMWWLSPIREPEPFVGTVLLLGGIGLLVELAFGWAKHEEVAMCADDLILAGCFGNGRRTPTESAVSHRLDSIEKPRSRRQLANALRWRLRLAQGTARPSPGYIRASAYPPLSRSQRRALLDEWSLVANTADRIEQGSFIDPRALVILWRFVTDPPPLDPLSDGRAYAELRSRLRAAWVLIEGESGSAAESEAGRGAAEQSQQASAADELELSRLRDRR